MPETQKATAIQALTKSATEAYDRILTRYPVMDRVDDARKRLEALRQPVPKPTKEAIALNRKEEESRRSMGMFGHLVGGFTRHPDVAQATKVGDPQLTDTQTVSATDVVRDESRAMAGGAAGGEHKVAIETVGTGAPPPSEPTPRSDNPAPAPANATPGSSDSPSASSPGADSAATINSGSNAAQVDPAGPSQTPPQNTGIGELKPNVPDSGTADGAAPTPPPAQVNELQQGPGSQASDGTAGSTASSGSNNQGSSSSATAQNSSSSSSSKDDDQTYSSSRKKKKKHKILPF
jgi:hypothetical protein